MAVTIPLTSAEQAALEAQAKSQGVSVDSLLRKAVLQAISTQPSNQPTHTAEELDRAFEEIADMLPSGIPVLSEEALSRESIYAHEDEWNRETR